jgi:hypothetical protein
MAFRPHVAASSLLWVACATFRPGPPKECPRPPNYSQPASLDRLRALLGRYRVTTVNIARDRHHPDVISGELTLTQPDTLLPYYWETTRGLERGPAPQLIGVLTWQRPMRGYTQDSVIVGYNPRSDTSDASLRSGRFTTRWDPKTIDYDVFAVDYNGFTGWWSGPHVLRPQYDPTPSKEERKKMVPDSRGYFCAKRIA